MTINKRWLRKWQESMFISLTKEQEAIILDHFGTEPEPYEWSELDITIQLRSFIESGTFVKGKMDYEYQKSLLFDNDKSLLHDDAF